MADNMDPPPLFNNVNIDKRDDDTEDLFSSAMEESPQLENVPIDNPSSAQHKDLEELEKESGDQFLEVSVTKPQKVGDGMGAYVAYEVATRTNMPIFKKRNFTVMRRFSDFLGLHDKLVDKYLRSGRIIPPAPEKSVIGMTKIKMSNQAEQGSSAEFVEKRRASLERYLNRTAAHPILSIDPDFREFLEAEMELPKATNTSALSGAGVMRLFNKVGETVNKITYKMDESDPWFEEKTQQVESLDAQLRRLHASVETLVLHRKDLALLTSAFAKSAAMLGNCEEHTSLSRALSQLADVEEKVEALHNEQANADFAILCELLKDYVALFGAIKDVFHERVKVYQNWQHSQQMLNKKREQKAKMELSGKQDKNNQAGLEVVEWEAKVERGQEEFDNISKMIKKEMERFEANRVKDFKAIIINYLETLMTHQQQLIKYWEQYLPEAKAIA
ncbi:sorting nexin-2 isoform X2 [Bacillus rossius redtenbacheri]|uniref:sorting nexin-2 isoform X2 n=1 Tax=Bacillus rossius redtenbacheri TaxID=93214 RepID=UPI002FDE899A